ncbi:MAG: hypothetical protein ACREU3_07680 [Steroidobacteraceae bacterium]
MTIDIPELWATYRRSSLASDASEQELESAWQAFHAAAYAIAKLVAGMADQGAADQAIEECRATAGALLEAQRRAPRRQ